MPEDPQTLLAMVSSGRDVYRDALSTACDQLEYVADRLEDLGHLPLAIGCRATLSEVYDATLMAGCTTFGPDCACNEGRSAAFHRTEASDG